MSNKRIDYSKLTVAMQKKNWRKICSKCYRLRYTLHGKIIKVKTSHKRNINHKKRCQSLSFTRAASLPYACAPYRLGSLPLALPIACGSLPLTLLHTDMI